MTLTTWTNCQPYNRGTVAKRSTGSYSYNDAARYERANQLRKESKGKLLGKKLFSKCKVFG